ncbi:hypothetical protein SAMN02745823_01011 [Sporobacter termitidis DSM 10068]|uniref:Uncharacterized protein n=2 Tax=Sporobacter TaxID=44748 RepID=A0A1M5VT10_9FIRM|nr:hypothetical protein SAMN02745823_01011 [Sporobacter termitidis DSM 10068]
MNKCQLLETIANLVLQSITVWEDVHSYALTVSSEYNAFWELLDDRVRDNALKYQKKNRDARIIPFSLSHIKYYEYLLTRDSFGKVRGLHWREQLRIILSDAKFRSVMTSLALEFRSVQKPRYDYVSGRAAINT